MKLTLYSLLSLLASLSMASGAMVEGAPEPLFFDELQPGGVLFKPILGDELIENLFSPLLENLTSRPEGALFQDLLTLFPNNLMKPVCEEDRLEDYFPSRASTEPSADRSEDDFQDLMKSIYEDFLRQDLFSPPPPKDLLEPVCEEDLLKDHFPSRASTQSSANSSEDDSQNLIESIYENFLRQDLFSPPPPKDLMEPTCEGVPCKDLYSCEQGEERNVAYQQQFERRQKAPNAPRARSRRALPKQTRIERGS